MGGLGTCTFFSKNTMKTLVYYHHGIWGYPSPLTGGGRGKGGGESRSFDVLDEGRRSLYRFEAKGLELFNERELHRYDFEPLKKAKDLWEGSLWIDSETGLLASVDAGLSKKSFGLKAFSMNMDFIDWEGMSLARQLTMEIHVKVPLLANMRIRTESKFRDFQRIPVP